jgi:hypothetical protein
MKTSAPGVVACKSRLPGDSRPGAAQAVVVRRSSAATMLRTSPSYTESGADGIGRFEQDRAGFRGVEGDCDGPTALGHVVRRRRIMRER